MRALTAALLLVFIVLQCKLWFSDGGLREVWRLEEQVVLQTEENSRLADRNAALEAEVMDLKQGLAAAEERARSELGLVKADEIFYQITPYRFTSSSPRGSTVPHGSTVPRGSAVPQRSTAPQ